MTIAQSIKYIGDRIGGTALQPVVNQFTFIKADPQWQNLLSDEAVFNCLFLDAPLKGSIDSQGRVFWDVRILFLFKSELDWSWQTLEGSLFNSLQWAREFVKLCQDIDPNESGIASISNVQILEVVHLFDVDASGHLLTARIQQTNQSLCVGN